MINRNAPAQHMAVYTNLPKIAHIQMVHTPEVSQNGSLAWCVLLLAVSYLLRYHRFQRKYDASVLLRLVPRAVHCMVCALSTKKVVGAVLHLQSTLASRTEASDAHREASPGIGCQRRCHCTRQGWAGNACTRQAPRTGRLASALPWGGKG